ncbi:MAG: sulfatase [Planctomycetota bacterium]|nr:sulfatase [Planctomycetota bacterium]
MRAVSLTLFLLGLLAACGSQHDDAVPPTIERVVVEMDKARAVAALPDPSQPAWALVGTWAVSDARDAYVVEIDTSIELPIPLAGPLDLTTAFALKLPPEAVRDDVVVEFEMRVVSKTRDQIVAQKKVTLHDAVHGWTAVHEQNLVRPEENARFVLSARSVALPPSARLCITPPRASDTRRFKSKPNVLVISVDALRADRMQSQGYARETTPRTDTLLTRGTRFQHAISVAPWTLPSYGTLFTGLMPSRHRAGVSPSREQSFFDGRALEPGDFEMLDPDVETLAARLKTAGYRTGGFVSNPYLDGALGIDRGFERWTMYLNRASAGVDLASDWIRMQGSQPWFCFLHLVDPHAPYTPPAPYDEQFAGVSVASLTPYPPTLETLRTAQVDAATKLALANLYDGEVASTDASIGKLAEFLDAAGLSNDTLIVFHSDHGEEFWEHGGYEHGHSMHAEVLRVPLAFVLPGRVPAGTFVTTPVSTLDVCATILELVGAPRLESADGTSLVSLFTDTAAPSRDIESEALLYGAREQKAFVHGGLKLITDGGSLKKFYDLASDPKEEHDLAAARAADVAILERRLLERVRNRPRPTGSGARPTLSPARRAELEGLGYTGPAAPR